MKQRSHITALRGGSYDRASDEVSPCAIAQDPKIGRGENPEILEDFGGGRAWGGLYIAPRTYFGRFEVIFRCYFGVLCVCVSETERVGGGET